MKHLDVGKSLKIIWNIAAAIVVIMILSGHINININLQELKATDIVSITLAFFSISLSVAFFYMAEKQSSVFYIHINNFIQETASAIGKLEERVKFMGDKQQELSESFKINIDYNKLLQDINSLKQSLEDPDLNKEKIKEEVTKLEKDLSVTSNTALSDYISTIIHRLKSHTYSDYGHSLTSDLLSDLTIKAINSGKFLSKDISEIFFLEMKRNNYLDDTNQLNDSGKKLVRDIAAQI